MGATLSLGAFAISACNMITGAGEIRLADDDSSVAGGGNDVNGNVGGATAGAGANPGNGAGAHDAGGSGTGLAGGTSGSGGTGVGAGPTVCEYPAGPYGVAVGQTVPPTITWQGYAPGASSASTISIQDLFDCDGSKGIDALLFDTSQFG